MEKFRISWKTLLIGLVFVGLILLIRDFNNRMAELHRLTLEREMVGLESTQKVATYSALETQAIQGESVEAAEEAAREQLKMVEPGDVPIEIIQSDAGAPQPTAIILPTPQTVEKWQLWLALFLDPTPQPNSP
jgi:cell division protein FtsB